MLSTLNNIKAINLCDCGLNKTTGAEIITSITKNTNLKDLQVIVTVLLKNIS